MEPSGQQVTLTATKAHVLSQELTFSYDAVFTERSDQLEVYNEVGQDAVNAVCNGQNQVLFVMGQTGSGKTYTMIGDLSEFDKGLCIRSIEQIFEFANVNTNGTTQVKVECSFFDLYNEQIGNLLEEDLVDETSGQYFSPQNRQNLSIFQNNKKEFVIKNLGKTKKNEDFELIHLHSFDDAIECLSKGLQYMDKLPNKNQSTIIFSIYVTSMFQLSDGSQYIQRGKLSFVKINSGCQQIVELPPSKKKEKKKGGTSRSKNQDLLAIQRKNSQIFGKTLGALTRVIGQIKSGKQQKFVSYRESNLTKLLKDSLRNSTFVQTICQLEDNLQETLTTMKFAKLSKMVENVRPRMQSQPHAFMLDHVIPGDCHQTKQQNTVDDEFTLGGAISERIQKSAMVSSDYGIPDGPPCHRSTSLMTKEEYQWIMNSGRIRRARKQEQEKEQIECRRISHRRARIHEELVVEEDSMEIEDTIDQQKTETQGPEQANKCREIGIKDIQLVEDQTDKIEEILEQQAFEEQMKQVEEMGQVVYVDQEVHEEHELQDISEDKFHYYKDIEQDFLINYDQVIQYEEENLVDEEMYEMTMGDLENGEENSIPFDTNDERATEIIEVVEQKQEMYQHEIIEQGPDDDDESQLMHYRSQHVQFNNSKDLLLNGSVNIMSNSQFQKQSNFKDSFSNESLKNDDLRLYMSQSLNSSEKEQLMRMDTHRMMQNKPEQYTDEQPQYPEQKYSDNSMLKQDSEVCDSSLIESIDQDHCMVFDSSDNIPEIPTMCQFELQTLEDKKQMCPVMMDIIPESDRDRSSFVTKNGTSMDMSAYSAMNRQSHVNNSHFAMHLKFLEGIINDPNEGNKLPEFGEALVEDQRLFEISPRKSNMSSKFQRYSNTPPHNEIVDQETQYKTPEQRLKYQLKMKQMLDEPEQEHDGNSQYSQFSFGTRVGGPEEHIFDTNDSGAENSQRSYLKIINEQAKKYNQKTSSKQSPDHYDFLQKECLQEFSKYRNTRHRHSIGDKRQKNKFSFQPKQRVSVPHDSQKILKNNFVKKFEEEDHSFVAGVYDLPKELHTMERIQKQKQEQKQAKWMRELGQDDDEQENSDDQALIWNLMCNQNFDCRSDYTLLK